MNGVHFLHADKHQNFYKFTLSFLEKYPKLEFGNIFVICWEKSVATTFVFYCNVKHADILRGSSHVRCYLVCMIWKWLSGSLTCVKSMVKFFHFWFSCIHKKDRYSSLYFWEELFSRIPWSSRNAFVFLYSFM